MVKRLSEKNANAFYHHAVISIAYCDCTLLDGKWEDLSERMIRRFIELSLPIRTAKVFSARRQGVEQFLEEIEQASTT